MTIATQIIATNATNAVQLSISQANEAPYERVVAVSFQNLDGSNGVYLGKDNTTSSTVFGYYLAPGQVYTVDLSPSDQIWGIAAAGTPSIAVLAVEA